MNETFSHINEYKVSTAFTKQSAIFDKIYNGNITIQYKRERVRNHVKQFLHRASYVLELNSGTGEDAIWFANEGHQIHATDISEGMQKVLLQKVKNQKLESMISSELCSFTKLDQLKNKGPYDLVFSNFAGLNCTEELHKVLNSFSPLIKSNGIVTLVILPKFCLWEFLLLFRGKFPTAFRRFFSKKGRKANIEGENFRCWYYNPSYIVRHLKKEFDLLCIEGLCTFVPPSYLENFAKKHPKKFNWLKGKEDKLKNKWPWKCIGDYYIISFRKKIGQL